MQSIFFVDIYICWLDLIDLKKLAKKGKLRFYMDYIFSTREREICRSLKVQIWRGSWGKLYAKSIFFSSFFF